MGNLSASFDKYIQVQTSEDDPVIYEIMKTKYFILHKVLGLYWDMKATKGRTVMFLILLFQTCFLFFYAYLFLMTSICTISWSIGYSMQAINYMMMMLSVISTFTTPLIRRREWSRIHKSIATDMFAYEELIEGPITLMMRTFISKMRKYVLLCPLFCFAGTVALTVCMPKQEERYVNGVDMTLPLGVWYPFRTDESWALYSIVILSQGFLFHCYIGFGTFWYLYLVLASLFGVMQMQRLLDSLTALQERATLRMKKKFPQITGLNENELLNDDFFNDCLIICLKENIVHHLLLTRYTRDFERSIGIQMLVVFLTMGVAMGTTMMTITADDFIAPKVNALLIGIVQFLATLVFCYIGQKMTDYSEDLRIAIYNLKWYATQKRISSYIKILMTVTSKPIVLSACGIVAFNLQTFTLLTEIAYKYYNVLIIMKK